MNIFFPSKHQSHDPVFEIFEDGEQIKYFESPARIESILAELQKHDWADLRKSSEYDIAFIQRVHSAEYLSFLKNIHPQWIKEFQSESEYTHSLYPTAHPSHTLETAPKNLMAQLGFFVKDLSAPITSGTFQAAVSSANCALSAANDLAKGENLAVGLCRPPGHHAGRQSCAGYCYLNNAAIAASFLADLGPVAILDIDYHAANGTQEIFFESNRVLTTSLHADPISEYPYFAGFTAEVGIGEGEGFNQNFPLPKNSGSEVYLATLVLALERIQRFNPSYLLVSAGFDTYKNDPLGSFRLEVTTYVEIGKLVQSLNRPTMVLLEGGYDIPSLGHNLTSLLEGLR